jgi:flagellin
METSWQHYHGGMLKMRVNNNIFAQNSYRNLSNTNNSLGKAIEKLSSGLRINRAADDAAGLGVSEKLRAQISGLDVAMTNAQDGIAVIQTAEGALDRTHAILRRVRDLTESSANGDKTDDDRAKYQAEVDQLLDEIDRISTTTEYNTKKLLTGSLGTNVTDDKSKLATTTLTGTDAPDSKLGLIKSVSVTGAPSKAGVYTIQLASDVTSSATRYGNADFATGSSLGADVAQPAGTSSLLVAFDMSAAEGETETLSFAQPSQDKTASVTLTESDTINEAVTKIQNALDEGGLEIDVSWNSAEGTGGNAGNGGFIFEARGRGADYNFFVSGQNSTGTSKIVENDPNNGMQTGIPATSENQDTDGVYEGNGVGLDATATKDLFHFIIVGPDNTEQEIITQSSTLKSDSDLLDSQKIFDDKGYYQGIVGLEVKMNLDDFNTSYNADEYKVGIEVNGGLTLQAGPNLGDDHRITVAIENMGSNALGVAGLDVSTQSAAQSVMDSNKIDTSIAKVSLTRGNLGAMQNRLEHTIKNLGVTRENLAASESRIRDADMAKEMMEFTKQQIMQQTGIAMLAQSNLSTQSVLQLLG